HAKERERESQRRMRQRERERERLAKEQMRRTERQNGSPRRPGRPGDRYPDRQVFGVPGSATLSPRLPEMTCADIALAPPRYVYSLVYIYI
ncbi:hypothetical protein KIPB_017082, partial [Kipferlia bialata]